MDNDITTERAAQVAHDEHLLELLRESHAAHHKVGLAAGNLWSLTGAKVSRNGYRTHPDGSLYSLVQMLDHVRAMAAGNVPKPPTHTYWDVPQMVADYDTARDAAAEIDGLIVDHEQNYTGWNRYFLVVSSAGHVHRTRSCQTCRPSTLFAPLPHLSGLDDTAAVALLGETLCTVCFPAAPVTGSPLKFPKAQAERLLNDGEEAFLAALAAARDRQAQAAAERCPGSGTLDHDRSGIHYYSKRAKCDHCGQVISVTSTLKLRQHKGANP